MLKRTRAVKHNERGRALADEGRTQEAIAAYEHAHEIDPEWAIPSYNLGLVYKYARDWPKSFDCNLRATQLDPSDQAGWWNLGIAATALGRWSEARRAWRSCGIEIPDGEGPIDHPAGLTPIRLNPDAEAEVVWTRRIDPARAVVESIPFPESGFGWGDLLLHDGAANGYRELRGRQIPVFDCLEMLQRSQFSTFVAEVELGSGDEPASVDLLVELAHARDLAAEDWSMNVRLLCKACSEGRPGAQHDHAPPPEGNRRIGIASPDMRGAERVIEDWRVRVPAIRVISLELRLEGR